MDYQQLHDDIVADGGYLGTPEATAVRMRAFTRAASRYNVTVMEYMLRFTGAERIAIRASTDPVIVDFMKLLDAGITEIDLQSDIIGQALGYMTAMSTPLLTEERMAEILSPAAESVSPYPRLHSGDVARAQTRFGGA